MAKSKKTNTDKEEKYIEKYLPFGVMIGVVVGSILGITLDNMMYLAYGSCGGLILGVLWGAIAAEGKKK